MLITSLIGFACNIVNFVALNCSCGKDSVEEEEDDTEMRNSIGDGDVDGNSINDLTIENKENVRKILTKPSAVLG